MQQASASGHGRAGSGRSMSGASTGSARSADRRGLPANVAVSHDTEFFGTLTVGGVFTYASNHCEAVLGVRPIEVCGRSIYEFVLSEDVWGITQLHRAAVDRGTDVASNHCILRVSAACAVQRAASWEGGKKRGWG